MAGKKVRSRLTAEELITALESRYAIELPDRYKRFLKDGEFKKWKTMQLEGYLAGAYHLDFVDPNLADVVELGIRNGILNMGDVPWSAHYQTYVPLARMYDPNEKGDPKRGETEGSRMFLVLDVKTPGSPVLLFDYEDWSLFPLAGSFENFLSELPKTHTDLATSFKPQNGETAGSMKAVDPSQVGSLIVKAQLLLKRGATEEALLIADQLDGIEPMLDKNKKEWARAASLALRGICYVKKQRLAEALPLLIESKKIIPTIGRVFAEFGDAENLSKDQTK